VLERLLPGVLAEGELPGGADERGGKYSYVEGSSRIAAMWIPLSWRNACSPTTGLSSSTWMPEYCATMFERDTRWDRS